MIGIINYGSGNLQAIANIYHSLDIPYKIASTAQDIESVDKLILPGVGAFDEVMARFNESGVRDVVEKMVLLQERPIIGICVGMQILAKKSNEGSLPGLGWIDGSVEKINTKNIHHKPYLPHMGWNSVKPLKNIALTDNLLVEKGFYFLHSYCFHCQNAENILMTTEYGETINSAVHHNNIYGVQFHPEKSHYNGIQIFKNFANL